MRHAIGSFVIPLVAVAGVLAGCSNSSHQSVEWYMEHQAERALKLQWCNDDMARATDVDCLNATKAKERAMLSGPGAVDSFKFDADAAKQAQGTAPASPAATDVKPAPKPQGQSAADTFKFKPDPKLFPNAATGDGGR
ncbi:MAG: hypothetical protein C0607_03650 [Azoarcus sp.]|nr:MAG: hypothetical protein C0607_03650 [Azoarcus sp.]TVT60051.1 MAG: hypothetical protein FHK80_03420 [Azoarcus sp. PHD]